MQLDDQLKLVKYKLDNVLELHERLTAQGRLSTIDFDLLLRNMVEVYEFYHILKMEKVLWNQADPSIYEQQEKLREETLTDDFLHEMAQENDEPVLVKKEESKPKQKETSAPKTAIEEPAKPKEPAVAKAEPINKLSLFEEKKEEPTIIAEPELQPVTPPIDTPKVSKAEQEPAIEARKEEPVWGMDMPEMEKKPEPKPVEATKPEPQPVQMPEPVAAVKEMPRPQPATAPKSSLPIESHIAINDKFIYIRELFGGDFDAYEQTIFDINNLDTRKEAIDYLTKNVVDKYSWHEKEEIANDFFALVQKHFDF